MMMEFNSCHYHVPLPSFICWSYSSPICKDQETIMKTHFKRTKAPPLYCYWEETNHYNGNNGTVYFLPLLSFSSSIFFIIKVEPSFSKFCNPLLHTSTLQELMPHWGSNPQDKATQPHHTMCTSKTWTHCNCHNNSCAQNSRLHF